MIRHLFALIWNRRRANLLLMTELFVSFLVLSAVSTLGAYLWRNYRRPLGFSIDGVWNVIVKPEGRPGAGAERVAAERMRQLLGTVGALPEVVAVAGMTNAPYTNSHWVNRLATRDYASTEATDALPAVLGIQLSRGRWFGPEDDAAAGVPVVVNERFARAHFGAADPIGRRFDEGRAGVKEKRIVGVVPDFRQDGELGAFGEPEDYVIKRGRLTGADIKLPRNLLVRLRPGITAAFEESMMRALHAAAPEWSFQIESFEELRRRSWTRTLTPLLVVGVVAAFLMIMVTLGLSGVVWQNVTRRTREIGLRRAKGATAAHIRWQLLGELLVMASLAMALGGVVVAHFPLLGLVASFTLDVYALGFAIAVLAIYVLVVVSGYYPTRLATRVQPFEALRYE
jgi:putative ABC transport system permease protein